MSLNLEETYKMNESLRKLSKNTNQLHTEPKCGQRWRHDDSTLWPIKKNHNNLCKAHIFTLITIVCCTLKKNPLKYTSTDLNEDLISQHSVMCSIPA